MKKLLLTLSLLITLTAARSFAQVQGDLEIVSVDPLKSPLKKDEKTDLVIGINQNGPDDLPTGTARVNIGIPENLVNWVLPVTITDACGNLWTVTTPNVTGATPTLNLRNNAPLPAGYGCTITIPVIGVATSGTAMVTVGSTVFGTGVSDPNGTNQGATGTIVVDGALPVTLINFSAVKENKTVLLNWATTMESNSDHFEIERSLTGKNWNKIGDVSSHGESSALINYSFPDTKPENGENLYRLKMIDKDATFAYSRIVSVKFDGSNTAPVSIYPNPSSDKVFLQDADLSQVNQVSIYNMSGNKVFGSNTINSNGINVSKLIPGTYILHVTNLNGSVSNHKIVIAR